MYRIFLIINFLFLLIILPSSVSAQQITLGANQKLGVPALYNPNATVGNLVGTGLQIAAIFAGLAVLVFLIWGAFDWITSGGDKEKVAGARRKITNALIGLALLALAGFIVALFGDIVGFNPLKTPELPKLGDPPTPIQVPTTTTP